MSYFKLFKTNKKPKHIEVDEVIKNDVIIPDVGYSLTDKKMFQFVNQTNEVLEQISSCSVGGRMNVQKISIPRIVLIGTQSSGKSSLVNRFIGMDILPVGDNMVTRTPVNIRLSTVERPSDCSASVSIFKDGIKEVIYSTELEKLNTTDFQNKIIDATNRITENRYSISSNQIFIDINSLQVENMTIVDLVGIVSIPCTDKGQPSTIVDDIKALITEQLEYPDTYAVVVVSSLVDLEADLGLSIIKAVQKTNPKLKAVGVLTKSDGLKKITKINSIVNNDSIISTEVMLNDGYFVVNNLSDNSDWYINTYGLNSAVIKKNRYGIYNLKIHLKKVLMSSINNKLTLMRSNLQVVHKDLKSLTPKLDDNLDQTTAKLIFITNMMYIMSKGISESFNSIGIWRNVGNSIKDTFDRFMKDTSMLDPFSVSVFPDSELNSILTNFIGYIPNANDVTYLVINRCLTDEQKQPVKLLLPYVSTCIDTLIKIIIHSVDDLLRLEILDIYPLKLNKYNISIEHFPKLRIFISDCTIDLLDTYRKKTEYSIHHLLTIHERHLLWHDQKDFDQYYAHYQDKEKRTIDNILNTCDDEPIELKHDPTNPMKLRNPAIFRLRQLLRVCFDKIVKTCQEEIYKTIAADIVKEFEHHFFIEITNRFLQMTEEKLNELFYETDDIIKNKKIYDSLTKKIEQLLKQSEDLIN